MGGKSYFCTTCQKTISGYGDDINKHLHQIPCQSCPSPAAKKPIDLNNSSLSDRSFDEKPKTKSKDPEYNLALTPGLSEEEYSSEEQKVTAKKAPVELKAKGAKPDLDKNYDSYDSGDKGNYKVNNANNDIRLSFTT